MARANTPPFGQRHAGRRRVMSVGELERRYGRNAEVELGSAPYHDAPDPYPDAYDDDPPYVPVRRSSRWIPVVALVTLGMGGLLGYGLYREGVVQNVSFARAPALNATPAVPVEPTWAPPQVMPKTSTELVTSVQAATPSEVEATAAAEPSVEPASPADAPAATATPAAAAPAKRAVPRAARSTDEDEAATLEMIRRERERLEAVQRATTAASPGDSADNPYAIPDTQDSEDEPTPPGYIEATP